MASKSFTIDHILHGHSTTDSDASVGETVYPVAHPQHFVPYWTGDSYCSSSSWPIQNPMALWLPQQGQHHAMPVDLSIGTQRLPHLQTSPEATPNLTPQSSMFNSSSNWMIPSAAMTGCWTSAGSPELLSYSHHNHHGLSTPLTSTSISSPFFLTHQHPHQAALRLAAVAARRHRHMPILHQQATRKGGQIRFTHRQSHCLEETFSTTRYLTPGQRRALANKLSLSERQVKTWFQNRRAKWRRTRKGEKLLMNVLPKIDNQTTIDVFDDEEDDDELEFSSEDEKKPTAMNNKHKQ